jgi:hypothetical protein
MFTPSPALPEMMLRAAGVIPPMVFNSPPSRSTPLPVGALLPNLLVPMKLPSILLPDPLITMPEPSKPSIISPRTVTPSASILSPLAPLPACEP